MHTMTAESIISARDLNVWLGKGPARARIVHDVNFQVAPGESFGLVGESGSGKSTILRTLMGVNKDISGTLAVDGLTVPQPDPRVIFRIMQMVFQDPYASLHPRHVIARTLTEPMKINKIPDTERRLTELLDDIGLSADFRFRYPHELSGGQRQRVAIARALGLSPKILLLDEPTSALDVSIQAEILNLLNSIRKKNSLTYIIVSHNLAVIAYMCRRIAVMQHGRIVEIINREELCRGHVRHAYTRHLLKTAHGGDKLTGT